MAPVALPPRTPGFGMKDARASIPFLRFMHPIDIIQSHYLIVLAFMAGMAVGVYVGLEAARAPETPADEGKASS